MARRFRQIEWLNTLWLSLSMWNDKQIICFSSHTQKSSVFEQCVPFSLSELSQWVQLIHRLINANVKYIAWQCVYNPSFCMYIHCLILIIFSLESHKNINSYTEDVKTFHFTPWYRFEEEKKTLRITESWVCNFIVAISTENELCNDITNLS